jgi:hypothetical protein
MRASVNQLCDHEFFLVFEHLRVALFDIRTKAMIPRTPTQFAAVTAIDADERHIAFGTASGQVVIAALNFVSARRFTVPDSPIVYVVLSLSADRVFFQSTKHV